MRFRPRGVVLSVLALLLVTATVTASRHVDHPKSPDISVLTDVLHTPIERVVGRPTDPRAVLVTTGTLPPHGPESSDSLLDTLADRGWRPTSRDCSGQQPCRPSRPTGQVFVDRSGAYLRVCRIGVDDGTGENAGSTPGPDTCPAVIAATRRQGAEDGQVAFVLQYPNGGIGRWFN